MDDATGLAEALLGLSEFKVLAVVEFPDELWISVETTADVVGCPRCGVRALARERMRVDIWDLPCFSCFGRSAHLAEASPALRRCGLRRQDLDRELTACAVSSRAH